MDCTCESAWQGPALLGSLAWLGLGVEGGSFPSLVLCTPCSEERGCGQRLGCLQSWAETGRLEGHRGGEQIPGHERNGEQLLEEVIGTQFTCIILQFLVQTFQTHTTADRISCRAAAYPVCRPHDD